MIISKQASDSLTPGDLIEFNFTPKRHGARRRACRIQSSALSLVNGLPLTQKRCRFTYFRDQQVISPVLRQDDLFEKLKTMMQQHNRRDFSVTRTADWNAPEFVCAIDQLWNASSTDAVRLLSLTPIWISNFCLGRTKQRKEPTVRGHILLVHTIIAPFFLQAVSPLDLPGGYHLKWSLQTIMCNKVQVVRYILVCLSPIP